MQRKLSIHLKLICLKKEKTPNERTESTSFNFNVTNKLSLFTSKNYIK